MMTRFTEEEKSTIYTTVHNEACRLLPHRTPAAITKMRSRLYKERGKPPHAGNPNAFLERSSPCVTRSQTRISRAPMLLRSTYPRLVILKKTQPGVKPPRKLRSGTLAMSIPALFAPHS